MTLKNTSEKMLKTSINIAVLVLAIAGVIIVARTGYSFGKQLFSAKGADKEPGREVGITVSSGDSQYDIAKNLAEEGVVKNALVFYIQIKLYSTKEDKIVPGYYKLNTSKSGEELVEILISPPEQETNEG